MSDYDRPGSGVAFWQAEAQRKSEKSPDFKGYILLEMDYKAGDKLQLVAWKKTAKTGAPFLTLKEDNYVRKQQMQGRVTEDVEVEYKAPVRKPAPKKDVWADDNDVPF